MHDIWLGLEVVLSERPRTPEVFLQAVWRRISGWLLSKLAMNTSDYVQQTRRRANLRHLIQSLDDEGVQSWDAKAAIFANMTGRELEALMRGDPISDELAREIEWSMHRSEGWLDREAEDALDD